MSIKTTVHGFDGAKLKGMGQAHDTAACPWRVIVKSADAGIRARRRASAERVIANLGARLPGERLLCFFDDEDFQQLKQEVGAANRGLYSRVKADGLTFWTDEFWGGWPDYVKTCIIVGDRRLFDHFTYLHGSTCSSEVGLTMTFAHELQHFVQSVRSPRLMAENVLAFETLRCLDRADFEASGLRACDIPHEREARIVAKRVAAGLFGEEHVQNYVEARMAEFVSQQDAADWGCIRGRPPLLRMTWPLKPSCSSRDSRAIGRNCRWYFATFGRTTQDSMR